MDVIPIANCYQFAFGSEIGVLPNYDVCIVAFKEDCGFQNFAPGLYGKSVVIAYDADHAAIKSTIYVYMIRFAFNYYLVFGEIPSNLYVVPLYSREVAPVNCAVDLLPIPEMEVQFECEATKFYDEVHVFTGLFICGRTILFDFFCDKVFFLTVFLFRLENTE